MLLLPDQVQDVLPQHGFAQGTMYRTGPDHTDPATLTEDDDPNPNPNPYAGGAGGKSMPRCIASGGAGWEVRWLRQQVRCERGTGHMGAKGGRVD